MAALIDAIDIKRKMFFEFENAFHCLDVEVFTPTARGGQTLVRIKMRNLLTRATDDVGWKSGHFMAAKRKKKLQVHSAEGPRALSAERKQVSEG
jgi:translation elongation factor P/translation initiation factor 5A